VLIAKDPTAPGKGLFVERVGPLVLTQ